MMYLYTTKHFLLNYLKEEHMGMNVLQELGFCNEILYFIPI